MKVIILLISSLFSQDSFLVRQGDVEVPLADLDAYVYLLQKDKRAGFAMQKQQIEKNIYTLLNVNIVYQHVLNSDLNDLDNFQDVVDRVNGSVIDTEQSFIDQLDMDEAEIIDSVKMYTIKTEYYKAMLAYLREVTTEETLKNSALEYYMVNKKNYAVPERRDLSVITLNVDDMSQEFLDSTLKALVTGSQDDFHAKALEISTDPSKASNQGHWGEFKKGSFNYPFSGVVFNAPVGVIPQVFEDRGSQYIVRVNEIKPPTQAKFDDVKVDIFKQLKNKAVVRKFQSIINTQANNELEVNPELVSHVFERYKVFIEE